MAIRSVLEEMKATVGRIYDRNEKPDKLPFTPLNSSDLHQSQKRRWARGSETGMATP